MTNKKNFPQRKAQDQMASHVNYIKHLKRFNINPSQNLQGREHFPNHSEGSYHLDTKPDKAVTRKLTSLMNIPCEYKHKNTLKN